MRLVIGFIHLKTFDLQFEVPISTRMLCSYIWMWVNICFVNALKAFHITKRISICFVSTYFLKVISLSRKVVSSSIIVGNKRNEIRFFFLGVSTKTYLDHNPLESWHLILFGIKSFFSLAEVTPLELTSNTM